MSLSCSPCAHIYMLEISTYKYIQTKFVSYDKPDLRLPTFKCYNVDFQNLQF